jgi:ParB family chromosome partitioning protein
MRKALGKGLKALIPDYQIQEEEKTYPKEIDISSIKEPKYRIRESLKEGALKELAASIQESGIIQPIVVRELASGGYELIAGQRRLEAAKYLNYQKIPAVIKDITQDKEEELLLTALIENIQRQELNPIEEANAYKLLNEEFNLSHESIAKRVGKDRSTITNLLRLLKLPDKIKYYISLGKLSQGHAKILLSLAEEEKKNEGFLISIADTIIKKGLSVRETENLVNKLKQKKVQEKEKFNLKELGYLKDYENELIQILATKVKIKPIIKGKGKIEIEYYTLEDLDRIITLLGGTS